MAYRCENPCCGYGPEWDQGLPVSRNANGIVPVYLRAESYSQHPRKGDHKPFDGLCLNCIDDMRRDEEEMAHDPFICDELRL